MKILLKNYGTVLGGRERALALRLRIEQSDDKVVLDFDGVRTLSHSFADELIGKLSLKFSPEDFKQKFQLINLTKEFRLMLLYVIEDNTNKK